MELTSNQIGNLGEAKAILEFLSHGFDVYTQHSGNNPFDFIVYRDNNLWIVEVKTTTKITSRNSYRFDLYGTSYGHDRTVNHKPLNENVNIIVCYIQPLDVLCYINSKHVINNRTITFRENSTKLGGAHQRIISEFSNLDGAL